MQVEGAFGYNLYAPLFKTELEAVVVEETKNLMLNLPPIEDKDDDKVTVSLN